jgi:hypothetical protein
MPKKSPPQELLRVINDTTIEALADIDCLYVSKFATDTSAAIQSGAVLLAIAVDNDPENHDGFRCLIGLRRGTEITPYLSNYFSRRATGPSA